MMDAILIAALLLVVILCVSSILWHRRQGELCDCLGDCANCRIQCRSNVKYYGTAAQAMPVMTENAKKRIRVESRISQALRKVREALDLICYWLFNLCAVAALIRGLVMGLARLFGRNNHENWRHRAQLSPAPQTVDKPVQTSRICMGRL